MIETLRSLRNPKNILKLRAINYRLNGDYLQFRMSQPQRAKEEVLKELFLSGITA
jgi:hypothetical protein